MQKYLPIFFVLFAVTTFAQPIDSLKDIVDSSVRLMEKNSLHRKEINWKDFKAMVYSETKGITDREALLHKFPIFFKRLNDFHGGIQTNTKWISWEEGKPKERSNNMLDSALRRGPHLYSQRIGDIGYFRVPGGSTKNISKVTQMLVDTLCKITPATAKGWIIDLRLNTGGNIWFMLPPFASLIGDGPLGGYKYLDGKQNNVTYIKDGKIFANDQVYSIQNHTCSLPSSQVPVVILTGSKTASSGEGVALAFKGRSKTIAIGESTAGFVTSNSSYPLRKDVTLILATGYMTDRTGRYYTTGLAPDILVEGGDQFYNLSQDKKVIKAIEWLTEKMK
jgi:carboxyl-terminal processing protease